MPADERSRPAQDGAAPRIPDTENRSDQSTPAPPKFVGTRASDVVTHRVDWWEPQLIPRDMLTLCAGREGVGKSTVVSSWATRETLNGGTVLWIASPEEPRAHVIVPRLHAAGADLDRVMFIDAASEHDSGLTIPHDHLALREFITQHRVTLVVIDPVKALLGANAKDTDRDVRKMLECLAQLAETTHCVVLGIAHFGKRETNDSGLLVVGSIAWSQVPRSVLSVAPDEDDGTVIVTNTKRNLARKRSLAGRINLRETITDDGPTQVGVLEWIGDTNRDARELLGRESGSSEVDQWLVDVLKDGPVLSRDLYESGSVEGHSTDQIKRAIKRIGARRRKNGGGAWLTELPPDNDLESRTGQGSTQPAPNQGGTHADIAAPLLPSRSEVVVREQESIQGSKGAREHVRLLPAPLAASARVREPRDSDQQDHEARKPEPAEVSAAAERSGEETRPRTRRKAGRPALPPVTLGEVGFTEIEPGKYEARARFRDLDGKRRSIKARGATEVEAEMTLRSRFSEEWSA